MPTEDHEVPQLTPGAPRQRWWSRIGQSNRIAIVTGLGCALLAGMFALLVAVYVPTTNNDAQTPPGGAPPPTVPATPSASAGLGGAGTASPGQPSLSSSRPGTPGSSETEVWMPAGVAVDGDIAGYAPTTDITQASNDLALTSSHLSALDGAWLAKVSSHSPAACHTTNRPASSFILRRGDLAKGINLCLCTDQDRRISLTVVDFKLTVESDIESVRLLVTTW